MTAVCLHVYIVYRFKRDLPLTENHFSGGLLDKGSVGGCVRICEPVSNDIKFTFLTNPGSPSPIADTGGLGCTTADCEPVCRIECKDDLKLDVQGVDENQ